MAARTHLDGLISVMMGVVGGFEGGGLLRSCGRGVVVGPSNERRVRSLRRRRSSGANDRVLLSLANPLTSPPLAAMSTALVVSSASDYYSKPIVAAVKASVRDDVQIVTVGARGARACSCPIAVTFCQRGVCPRAACPRPYRHPFLFPCVHSVVYWPPLLRAPSPAREIRVRVVVRGRLGTTSTSPTERASRPPPAPALWWSLAH